MRRRVLVWAAAVAALAVAVAVYLVERDGMAPAPRSLLTQRPAFPQAWPREAESREARLGWRASGTRAGVLRTCGTFGSGAQRFWQYTPDEFGDPHGSQTVCTYKSELLARSVYIWQSLPGVAGEADLPNFESWSDVEPTPKDAAGLKSDADEWEIGCGLGDPDDACQVWIYRGRYGRTMMAAEFHYELGAAGGGIPLADARVFFESLDDDLARRLRRI